MANVAENTARENMLKSQILTGHVLNPGVLDALLGTPREAFVPEAMQGSAYIDEELPLGHGRFLMEPLAFARLLEYAAIKPHETVLDIGAGTGYSAVVLSKLAQKVVAVEEDAALAAIAKPLLASFPNIEFAQAPLASGLSKNAPYDVIIIEGAIEFVPQAIADQLAEGGRLLAAQQEAHAKVAAAGLGALVEYRKLRGALYMTTLRDASVALLAAFKKPALFAL